MKKTLVFGVSAALALAAFLPSCNNGPSTKVALSNEMDSIAYSYGVALYEQGLSSYIQQMGLVGDTAVLSMQYTTRLGQEEDANKRADLIKERTRKIDSLQRANEYNIAQFLSGMNEGIAASESQQKYNMGLALGNDVGSRMLPALMANIYGEGESKGQKMNHGAIMAGVAASLKKERLAFQGGAMYFESKMGEIQKRQMTDRFQDNKEAGEKFLSENKAKEGIVTLESGVQYKVVKKGTGALPTATSKVKCHYHGTLINGTVFDSSIGKDPISFSVGGVIPGWTEVLQLMPVGSKWEVYIPQELAYGSMDRGEIKPFSALVFEIELLGVEN